MFFSVSFGSVCWYFIAKCLAGKTYSRDIFRFEGSPYRDQIEELFIIMVVICIPNT